MHYLHATFTLSLSKASVFGFSEEKAEMARRRANFASRVGRLTRRSTKRETHRETSSLADYFSAACTNG